MRPRRYRLRRSTVVATAALLVAAAMVGGHVDPVAADNCSSPSDCEQTAGYNTVIAVAGGVAAVAAAAAAAVAAAAAAAEAAAAAAAAAGAPPGADGNEPPEPPDIVIIQVDPVDIDVTADVPGQFVVTAWRATEDGGIIRAPDVPLSLSPPSDPAIQASPMMGTGELMVSVTLVGAPIGDTATITATGTAKGGSASQQILVHLGEAYDLELY